MLQQTVLNYNEIENLSKSNNQIEYIRHEMNRQFYGNFKSCLTQASSKYILIISDEDFVNFDGIKSILDELEQYPNLGACAHELIFLIKI